MNKIKALEVLARHLAEVDDIQVIDAALAPVYLKNGLYSHATEGGRYITKQFTSDDLERKLVYYGREIGANYFFITPVSETRVQVSPFAYLDEDEKDYFRDMYNPPPQIYDALSTLNLGELAKKYGAHYKHGTLRFAYDDLRLRVSDEAYEEVKSLTQSSPLYLFDRYELDDLQASLEADLFNKAERKFIDDYRFVFDLPFEDQNKHSNIFLFRKMCEFESPQKLLMDQYTRKSPWFLYYFTYTPSNDTGVFVAKINALPIEQQDLTINTFLYEEGYKIGNIDAIRLANMNPLSFFNYFREVTEGKKYALVEQLITDDSLSSSVVKELGDYLQEHCQFIFERAARKVVAQ